MGVSSEMAQVVVATGLLRVRDWKWVKHLKAVLITNLVFAAIAIGIDAVHFQDSVAFDVLGLVWPTIWLPYFSRSTRVERVFKTKDWGGQTVVAIA